MNNVMPQTTSYGSLPSWSEPREYAAAAGSRIAGSGASLVA